MNTPALKIDHLRKQYGNGFVAVDDISFTVPRGQFFGFLGPNGAGKSTTIHCITGIAQISSGTIEVLGIDVVKKYRETRKRIGLSPQEFDFEFFGPVYKTLEYVAGYYGIPRAERVERIDQLIEQFGLKDHKDKRFNELSGGLKRRVILVRALIHDPELLIFDEPTAGVDVEMRHDLWRYFRELNKAGKTIILTSHYLEEVEMLCDRIAIINGGKIVAIDDKSAFIKDGKTLEERYLAITKGEVW
ncbi:ABC transporter ATP-binding protein [Patescibacteria group bacterium]|nr:ABC transporter ATP-binding protein [Patescibacteria group bacterium]